MSLTNTLDLNTLFTLPSAPGDPASPAPELTFLWSPHTHTLILPSPRSQDDPTHPLFETLTIRTLFNRHELHFDALAPAYQRLALKARAVPHTTSSEHPAPAKVDEAQQCPICLDGTAPEVVFRCCHAFCKECTLALAGNGRGKPFACPFCRERVSEVAAVIEGAVNEGEAGYLVKYDEETSGKLRWEELGGWVAGMRAGMGGYFVVRLKGSGEVVVRRFERSEGRIEVPAVEKPLGMAVVTWALVCLTKMVADDVPMLG